MLNNTPVLGPGYAIALGEPLEWHETLRRMEHPMRERRRLTFARAKLFGEQLPCKKWQREIADIAGASNVDFTWVFNSGNGQYALTSHPVQSHLETSLTFEKQRQFSEALVLPGRCFTPSRVGRSTALYIEASMCHFLQTLARRNWC